MNETAAFPARSGISAACPSRSTGQSAQRAYKAIHAKVSVHVAYSIAGDPAMQPCEYQFGVADSSKSAKEFSDLASVALLPVSVVALGSEPQSVERLLWLQSAVAKGVHMAAVAGQFCFRLTVQCFPRLSFGYWQSRKPTWGRHN